MKAGCVGTGCCNGGGERDDDDVEYIRPDTVWTQKSEVARPYV